ncbi:MAG: hypothetical protein OHK0052_01210 [Anaerolineales bacterium]
MNEITFQIHIQPEWLKYGFNSETIQHNIHEWLAISLFTDGIVSTGKAARLLGISRIDFLTLLKKRGIAYLDYSQQELDEEFATLNRLNIEKHE